MSFPTIVYRCPGPHQRKGGTFDYKGVADKAQLEAALADGWHTTLTRATGEEPTETAAPTTDDKSPPTRDELEQKAKELGIKFNKKMADDELLELINIELEG